MNYADLAAAYGDLASLQVLVGGVAAEARELPGFSDDLKTLKEQLEKGEELTPELFMEAAQHGQMVLQELAEMVAKAQEYLEDLSAIAMKAEK